jgi:hypothetical protein
MSRGIPKKRISLDVPLQAQPTDTSCGPTCLHAVYAYYGDDITLQTVIDQIPSLDTGGTLGVMLGLHALQRGYEAVVYSSNLRVLDPTWFQPSVDLRAKLALQAARSRGKRRTAAEAYRRFVEAGGKVRFEDLTGPLIRRYLQRETPILAGLSATHLYHICREDPETGRDDDIEGAPLGHFVILSGYQAKRRRVTVNDPYQKNPLSTGRLYHVPMERLLNAILLGVLTYDGNLLIVSPK